MHILNPPTPAAAERFRAELLTFINHVLPHLDRRHRAFESVSTDTPLFETGLLDSLSILHLIAKVEELTGAPVPDQQVVMKNFRTIDAIAAAFSPTY